MSEERIEIEEIKPVHYNAKAMMFVLLLGSFLVLFNETILNVAFPKLMVEMHVSATTVQWLTTGYVLVVGILVPVTAFLMHTFTTKKLYIGAISLFLLGTICAVFSNSFTSLLISKLIQALGTGMLIPIMMNSALIITPPKNNPDGVAIVNTAMQVAGALGSALFVGIMTAFQTSYLKNSRDATKAIFNGFSHSVTVAAVLMAVGFVLSLKLASNSKIRK